MLNNLIRRQVLNLVRQPAFARAYSAGGSFEHIIVSKPAPGVRLIQLNRPKALNALFTPLIVELNKALDAADKDTEIGAIVLTGSERSFAGKSNLSEYYPYIKLTFQLFNSWCRYQRNEGQELW